MVHGWNPQGYLNKFAPDDSGRLSNRWAELASTLVADPIVQQFGWTVARYDWSRDAATGATFPWQATDAAMAHGAKLGQLVLASGATHVQFIAHSAGNWAARRAAAYLKLRNPAIQIQITALDPFVTDSLQPAFELTSLWTDYLDNYYVVDWATDRDVGLVGLDWTSGNFAGWSNDNIEVLDPYFESWMIDHSGPVSWYAVTATEAALRSPGTISFDDGFPSGLPVRLASAAIDNFPGQRLIGDSGSVSWFTYQATAQSSEPAHGIDTPARRSVWGNWTAPASGTVTFDTFGADFYDVLAAYTGSSIASLKPVARDYSGGKGPGQCEIAFTASAGQTYYIAVDGILGAAGQSPLHWRMSGGAPTPTLTITSPAANATVSRVATVSASANSATKVEFYLDGVLQFTDAATPFAWAWNTTTATGGSHTISAKSYSGTALLVTSAKRTVTVSNSETPPPDCPDANEPNNSSLTATPLALDTSLNGYICSAADVDWFKITVTKAGTLSLNLTVPTLNDYDLELYGPDSTFRQGSYRDLGQAEDVTVSVPTPGTYYARVYGYPAGNGSFSATQTYKLTSLFAGASAAQSGAVLGWGAHAMPLVQPETRFTAIAGGWGHILALKLDGTVVAWGNNGAGQSLVPNELCGVIAIAAGVVHSLALRSDGTVVSWGYNYYYGRSSMPSGLSGVIAIASGSDHALALKCDGTLVAWGDLHLVAPLSVPSGLRGVIAVAAGAYNGLALKSDGTVMVWGNDEYAQRTLPNGLSGVIAMAAAPPDHSLALKSDGTVVAWGDNHYGQSTVPNGLSGVVAIAAGYYHSLALKSDGTVVAWGAGGPGRSGDDHYGQSTVPSGLSGVIGIAAGSYHSLALKSDGTVVTWGDNRLYQRTVPSGLRGVVAVSAQGANNLALKTDGTVVAWGYNQFGQNPVPSSLGGVIAIAAGSYHNLALKSDGTLVAWGWNGYGQSTVPTGLNRVIAIAAAPSYSLVILAGGQMNTSPSVLAQPLSRTVSLGQAVSFAVSVNGTPPLTYQWRHNGTDVAGAAAATLTLSGVKADDAGGYSVLVADAFGTATSTVATLTVLPASPLADYATSIAASISGNRLILSWPTTHLGWILQTQTSSLDTGITSTWVDVPGSGSSTTKAILLSPTRPASFFRLRYP